jgi:hypothetical protein
VILEEVSAYGGQWWRFGAPRDAMTRFWVDHYRRSLQASHEREGVLIAYQNRQAPGQTRVDAARARVMATIAKNAAARDYWRA